MARPIPRLAPARFFLQNSWFSSFIARAADIAAGSLSAEAVRVSTIRLVRPVRTLPRPTSYRCDTPSAAINSTVLVHCTGLYSWRTSASRMASGGFALHVDVIHHRNRRRVEVIFCSSTASFLRLASSARSGTARSPAAAARVWRRLTGGARTFNGSLCPAITTARRIVVHRRDHLPFGRLFTALAIAASSDR